MSNLHQNIVQRKIARSLDHLKSNPWLLKPTIEFILSYEHKNNCRRIRDLFFYLNSFGKQCPFFNLFFYSLIYRKYKPDSFIRPDWTKTDETDVNLLKIQICLYIPEAMSQTNESKLTKRTSFVKTTAFESLL